MTRDERRLSAILRAAPLLLFAWMVRSLLVPVALGAVIALLLAPLKERIAARRPGLARAAPVGLTAGVLVLIVLPLALVAVRVAVSAQAFFAVGLAEILDRVESFGARHFGALAEHLDLPGGRLRAGIDEISRRAAGALGTFAGGAATALPGHVIEGFLFVVALYFFLRDGAAFVRWTSRLLPFRDRDTDRLYASIQRTVHGALMGQLVVSAVQGGLSIAALYLFRVPGALVLGILALVLSVLPLVGTMPVTVGAVIYLLASGRIGAAAGMSVAAMIIGVSDNVIRPWVQSADTRMHPLLTLLAIFGGIELMGFAGVFLGPVIAAIAMWALNLGAQDRASPEPDGAAEDRAPPEADGAAGG